MFEVLSKLGVSSSFGTLVSILFAMVVYVLVLVLIRGIAREDIISLPKGKKIAKVLEKLKIIR